MGVGYQGSVATLAGSSLYRDTLIFTPVHSMMIKGERGYKLKPLRDFSM